MSDELPITHTNVRCHLYFKGEPIDQLTPEERAAFDAEMQKALDKAFEDFWPPINTQPRSPALPLYEQNYKSAVLDRNGKVVKVIDDGTEPST